MTRQHGKQRCIPDWPETVLRAMPGTLNELSLRTGTPKGTMKEWALKLRLCGWAHVTTWITEGPGKQRPVITAGPGKNKPCPPSLTKAERSQLFRDRARKDGRYEVILGKQKAVRRAETIRRSGKRASPFDALYGGRRN